VKKPLTAEDAEVHRGTRTMKTNDIDSLCVLEACPEPVEGYSAVKKFCIFSHLLKPTAGLSGSWV
jgi:hypothetical protein